MSRNKINGISYKDCETDLERKLWRMSFYYKCTLDKFNWVEKEFPEPGVDVLMLFEDHTMSVGCYEGKEDSVYHRPLWTDNCDISAPPKYWMTLPDQPLKARCCKN